MESNQLHYLTEQLINACAKMEAIFTEVKRTDEQRDFFHEVKPFADNVHQLLAQWNDLALPWVQQYRPKHIFPQQLITTKEHMEKLAVEVFYPTSSWKRLKSTLQSCLYILHRVKEALERQSK
ncbi:MAG: YppE family protein [Bacillus sp. (in: Bacteria)]|jgi:hypothetical protein|nr:YppE family protein [Bacillus sp. (in: firmicutes)]